jgi:hypothetical protein
MESLYSISQRYNALMALLDDDSISQEDVNNALVLIDDELQNKGENILSFLQKLDDIEEQAKRRKKEIDTYIKGIANKKKRLEKACLYALDNMQVKSILTSKGEIKAKKNPPSVVIDDYSAIPGRYISTKIDYVVDRTAIKAAIKAGEEVPGAHLEQRTSLSY